VLFCEDFCQLNPPTATAIAALPSAFIRKARKYGPGATEEHGKYIYIYIGARVEGQCKE